MTNVALIVGAGTMGTGVAAAFLGKGWSVRVVEPDESARRSLATRLSALLPCAITDGLNETLKIDDSLADVDWSDVRIVSESAFEDLAVKTEIFRQLGRCAPEGIPLTSNSSTLTVDDIAGDASSTRSMLNAHFLMPAHAVPLVEVYGSPDVDPEILRSAMNILTGIGKKPIRLRRARPGLLVNRIQAALMREALALLEDGVASAHDIDDAVRFGFGFRYAACGPFLQKEHSGWDVSYRVYESVFPSLANDATPPRIIGDMIAKGDLGMKTGRGLVAWTPARIEHERKRYNDAIERAMAVLDLDGPSPSFDWTGANDDRF